MTVDCSYSFAVYKLSLVRFTLCLVEGVERGEGKDVRDGEECVLTSCCVFE
jgi:hypothetical protein